MSKRNPTLQKWRMAGKLSILLMLMVGLMNNPFATEIVEAKKTAATQTAIPGAAPLGANAPNIVVFLADDMGYTDVGVFGGEIPTPNIDSLATTGLMMTNFHTMASCSPTRVELLTGVDNHRAGFGTMASQLHPTQVDQPGYEVVMNDRVVTIASLLRNSGYHTFMAGKWHMGNEGGDNGNFWPNDRGFEKSFALLPGAASHFSDRLGFSRGRPVAAYIEDGVEVEELPEDFYSTDFYTNKVISYTQAITDGNPFFAYFAYTAPHGPLHVPADDLYVQEILSDTVNYNYQAGWDVLRERRFNRMKALGILPNDLTLPPRWTSDPLGNPVKAWVDLTPDEQAFEAKRMAIYAAMIRHLDDNIGRFIQHLKDTGQYDNTVFVFMGDNGADDLDRTSHPGYVRWFQQIEIDNSLENIGNVHSFIVQGASWAQVSATPFWAAKATVAEGGIRNSFIASYQGADANNPIIPAGSHNAALSTIMDLTPTFLDYAGILDQHPGVADPAAGQVFALDGRSMRTLWQGNTANIYGPDDYIGFELFGTTNKALISGDGWKILRLGEFPWEDAGNEHESDQNWKLYNLNEDPSEQTNLAAQFPDRFRNMQARYRAYEAEVGFVSAYLRDVGAPGQLATYTFDVTNRDVVTETFELSCETTWPCTVSIGAASQAPTATVTLAPAASAAVTLTLSVPADIAPDGSRYVNEVDITALNNPRLQIGYTVITFVGETSTVAPGQTAAYAMTIANNTNATDTFDVVCVSGWSCTLKATQLLARATTAPTLTVTLDASQSTQIDVMVAIPADTESGLFDIARVTSTSQNTSEATTRAFLTSAGTAPTEFKLYLPFLSK